MKEMKLSDQILRLANKHGEVHLDYKTAKLVHENILFLEETIEKYRALSEDVSDLLKPILNTK